MKIRILGCGSSGGVPLITGHWGNCDPTNPKNRRRRSSILIQIHGKNILIDAGPDIREQLLDAKINHLDAVIFTHAHADHIRGTDELRHFSIKSGKKIPVYADQQTLDYLKMAYKYAFEQRDEHYLPFLEGHLFTEEFYIESIKINPLIQQHGYVQSWSIRIENFAYSTDFSHIPDQSLSQLQNLTCWIVDCLRIAPHPTHSNVSYTLDLINRLSPKQAILTHMSHEFDYEEAKKLCPPAVCPAFDGMMIEIVEDKINIYDKIN